MCNHQRTGNSITPPRTTKLSISSLSKCWTTSS
jgi:hypothetical protein